MAAAIFLSHVALPVRHGGKIEINVFGGFRSPASRQKTNQKIEKQRKRRKFIKNFAASWADRKRWQQRESTETQRNMIGALDDCVRGATRMCRRLSKCRHAQITLKDLSLPAAHTPHTHTTHTPHTQARGSHSLAKSKICHAGNCAKSEKQTPNCWQLLILLSRTDCRVRKTVIKEVYKPTLYFWWVVWAYAQVLRIMMQYKFATV